MFLSLLVIIIDDLWLYSIEHMNHNPCWILAWIESVFLDISGTNFAESGKLSDCVHLKIPIPSGETDAIRAWEYLINPTPAMLTIDIVLFECWIMKCGMLPSIWGSANLPHLKASLWDSAFFFIGAMHQRWIILCNTRESWGICLPTTSCMVWDLQS